MIALGIVVVIALLFIFFIALRRRSPATLRRIPAFDRLNREIGLAVENGTRLHISLGRGNFFTARGGSALADVAAYLQSITGVNFIITPKANTDLDEEQKTVKLKLDTQRSVRKVLDLIAKTHENLRWKIEDGVVKSLHVEAPGKFEVSRAEGILEDLK